MNAIQVGDTVEVVHNCFSYANSDSISCKVKAGDRFIVTRKSDLFVYYTYDTEWMLFRADVKKVIPNEVEVKFR
jgi:hypothetical protein